MHGIFRKLYELIFFQKYNLIHTIQCHSNSVNHQSIRLKKIINDLKIPICKTSAQSVGPKRIGKGERRHERGCAKKGLKEIRQANSEKGWRKSLADAKEREKEKRKRGKRM